MSKNIKSNDPSQSLKGIQSTPQQQVGKSVPNGKQSNVSIPNPTVPLNEGSATDPVMNVTLTIGSFGVDNASTLTFYSNGIAKRELFGLHAYEPEVHLNSGWYSPSDSEKILKKFNSFNTGDWPDVFQEEEFITLDGVQWSLEIHQKGKRTRTHRGSNAYPPKWKAIQKLFGFHK